MNFIKNIITGIVPAFLYLCQVADGALLAQTSQAKNSHTFLSFTTGSKNLSSENSPGLFSYQNNVFIKEEGQFKRSAKEITAPIRDKILFGVENREFTAFFTKDGVAFQYPERAKNSEFEEKENESEKKDLEKRKRSTKWHTLYLKFVGSATEVSVEGTTKVSHYFNYDAINDDKQYTFVPAYKKLLYKSIYRGIDIEFELANEGGLKYQFILHPGAKLEDIKMRWEGASGIKLDDNGNLVIDCGFKIDKGATDLILLDRSPTAFKTNGKQNVEVKYELQNDGIIQFKGSVNKITEEIIIDPWITNPNYPGVNRAFEIQEDSLGNVYTLGNYSNNGSGDKYWIQKYDPSGVLQWTNQLYSIFLGDIAVDKTGNVYYCGGYSTGNREKLNTAGVVQWSLSGLVEEWRLAFNYDKTILIIGGYFVNPSGNNLAQLDVNTGAISNQIVYNLETRAIAAECNGDIYSMHVTFGGTPGNPATNILNKTSAAFTPLASTSNGYSIAECENGFGYAPNPDYNACIFHGFNGLTIIGPYVYTYDGATLKRFNKNNLALAGTVVVPNGSYMTCSGVASDLCGNVFVGTSNGIAQFDSSMNYLGAIATPGPVYDIMLGVGKTYLLASGQTFIGNFTGPCVSPTLSATVNNSYSCITLGSATVTPSGGLPAYSYQWIPSGLTTASVSGLSVGTHTYIVTDSYCQIYQGTVTIVPSPPLTATITSTNISCNGGGNGTATMTASGGVSPYTYNWSNAQTTSSVPGLISGIYTCTVTSSDNCTSTQTVTITEPPILSATTIQTDVACNGAATGSASVTPAGGTPGYTYSWLPVGGTSAAANNLSAGNYTCTITDLNACVTSQTFVINQPPPLTAMQSQTNALCNGSTGSATVTPGGGTPAYSYAWLPSGGNGAAASGLNAGSYTCTITDLNSCVLIQTFSITQPSAVTTTQSQTNALCKGGSCSATVSPNGGTPGYTYTWSPSGGNAATASGLNAGNYQVQINDANNCTSTLTFTLTEPTKVTITASASPTVICIGNSVTLSSVPAGGVGGYTFLWMPGNLTAQNQNINPSSSTTYSLHLSDANGCSDSTTVSVAVNPLPIALAGSNSAVCTGDTIKLNGNGGNLYTWNGPLGFNSSSQNPSITNSTVLMSGTYSLSVTDNNNCSNDTTVQVLVNPLPAISVTSATICIGNSATLTAGGANTYTWNTGANNSTVTVSPVLSTNYTVSGTDANTCSSFSTTTVIVNPLPIVTVNSATICLGKAASLNSTGAFTYTWTPSTGLNTNQGSTVTANPAVGTNYTVVGTDLNGCIDTATCTVKVNPLPYVIVGPPTTSGCVPLCVDYDNAGTSSGSCLWIFGDGTRDSSSCTPQHCFTSAGTFSISLQLTDSNNCVNTSVGNAIVYPKPIADFDASPQPTTILDPTIHFYDASTMANIAAWSWSFGDGDSTLQQFPSHMYNDTGTYAVQLSVISDYGCKDSIIKYIVIDDDYMIYVPNAFTPNFDGTNDVFIPKGLGIVDFKLYIFDRWGMLIFFSNDQHKGWDGRIKGSDIVQEDVYVWKLEVKNKKGEPKLLKGVVSLLK